MAVRAVVGLAAPAASSRVLDNIVYGIATDDRLAFVAAPLALIAAALFAWYVPARGATQIEPMEFLRAPGLRFERDVVRQLVVQLSVDPIAVEEHPRPDSPCVQPSLEGMTLLHQSGVPCNRFDGSVIPPTVASRSPAPLGYRVLWH